MSTFRILGPVQVVVSERPVPIGGRRQVKLLAALLLRANQATSSDELRDAVWGSVRTGADNRLPMAIARLRKALEPLNGELGPRVQTVGGGYMLRVASGELDAGAFQAGVLEAQEAFAADDPARTVELLNSAFELWRGPPLAEVAFEDFAQPEIRRLEELRLEALELRADAELACGNHRDLVGELEALLAQHPTRERLAGQLMIALYRCGRQGDALQIYSRTRNQLVEELGLDPGPALKSLQAEILNQATTLDGPRRELTEGRTGRNVLGSGPSAPRRRSIPLVSGQILGRENELAAAQSLIKRDGVRVVTLTGVGGIGKTRLAIELANRLEARCELVDLTAIREPGRVTGAIAAAIGATDPSDRAIAAALGPEPTVLFLDNFEQVLAAAPDLTSLVSAIDELTVVVTSRAPLRIALEHEFPLHPLASATAAALFVERACEQDPSFSPGPGDRECIEAICTRIDGLPLAVELAAARTRVLTPRQILDRLGHRLDVLTSGRRDGPERHRTLRTTIAWSYDLLKPEEQRLFGQLAVFQSGWSLEAAEAVADGPVLDTLSALVEHCLVVHARDRFGMLETVREYAVEQLERTDEDVTTRHRHAVWCRRLAEAAEPELEGPRQSTWFVRLDAEAENLRAASAWGLEHGSPEIPLGLVGASWRFWLARGSAREVRGVLNAALRYGRGDEALRSKALNAAGILAGETGDLAAAAASFHEALRLAEHATDRRQVAKVLANLGVIDSFTHDYAGASRRYREAADIWHELGDLRGESVTLQNLGIVHDLSGQPEQALPLVERSVQLARAAGDRVHVASTLTELGRLLVQHAPSDMRIPSVLREALVLSAEFDDRHQIVECLEVLAAVNAISAADIGAELIGAADAERERTGVARRPDEWRFLDATARALEEALAEKDYRLAHDRGRCMTLDSAVALALKSTESRARTTERLSQRKGTA